MLTHYNIVSNVEQTRFVANDLSCISDNNINNNNNTDDDDGGSHCVTVCVIIVATMM